MKVTAKLRYLRIAPRKVRLVADLISGKSVEEAQNILNFTQKRAAFSLSKLLKQAIANARNTFQLDEKNLFIPKILIDEGPKLKRVFPRARGKADEIQKKTSHITIFLDEIEKRAKKVEKAKKVGKVEIVERVPKIKKPKLRPKREVAKPKLEKGVRRIFRRTAF